MLSPDEQTRSYLDRVLSLSPDGGVMDVYPINVFELAWALRSLAPLREEIPEFEACAKKLARFWGPGGVSFTDSGMVSDADDTAAAAWVLKVTGLPLDPHVFELFEGQESFVCFPFERNPSVMANAGTLDALKLHESTPDHRRMVVKLVHYLRGAREPEGFWIDKWHVSQFYATARCIAGLNGIDADLVRTAVNWILEAQHEDGSWGVEGGIPEETAYALDGLIAAGETDPALKAIVGPAVEAGGSYLGPHLEDEAYAELWVGKGLYAPGRVVKAAIIGALARALSFAA